MHDFQYYAPTKVFLGRDVEKKAPELLKSFGGTHVLLVYGGESAKKSGLLEKVTGILTDGGLMVTPVGGVQPNPLVGFVNRTAAFAKEQGVDCLLALGGGSVIDTVKAVAHKMANPEDDVWDYCKKRKNPKTTLPFGAILTLPASGSEMSDSAVLTNEELKEKRGITSELNRPKFALLNPENAATLPVYQVGNGVADILMHTLERYLTKTTGNDMTDEIAEALLRTVIRNGGRCVLNPADYDAMSEIMWAGSLSHNGITGLGAKSDFACHQLGHELSAKYDAAHGASLTAVWRCWAEYVFDACPARFARFARNVWGIEEADETKAALKAIAATNEYFTATLRMPGSIPALVGHVLTEEELSDISARCAFFGERTIGAFKVLSQKDILAIYRKANTY